MAVAVLVESADSEAEASPSWKPGPEAQQGPGVKGTHIPPPIGCVRSSPHTHRLAGPMPGVTHLACPLGLLGGVLQGCGEKLGGLVQVMSPVP